MKQEDIIRMAQEAGGNIYEVDWCFEIENLQRFAALVEQRVARECAETEIYVDPSDMTNLQRRWHSAGVEALRGAIRTNFLTGEQMK